MKRTVPLLKLLAAIAIVGTFLALFFDTPKEPEAEAKDTKKAFIEKFAQQVTQTKTDPKILASVVVAQAILESNWGDSQLSSEANNYFGIKGSYKNNSYDVMTFEYIDGEAVDLVDSFRKYPSIQEGIRDYFDLLKLDRYAKVLNAKNYAEAARAIQAGGYATDPKYADKLINIIETYALHEYDR